MLIAGGGTGGHLFPGIAVAEEVITRHPKNDVLFVGTQRGLEARVVPQAGFKFKAISSRGLKRVGLLNTLLGILTVPISLIQSILILLRFRPDVVLGVGGYSSGPVVLAAWLLRIPTAIQEQNAIPGFTNRILGKLADVVFLSFEGSRIFFPKVRAHLIGNPIRKQMMDNFLRSTVPHERFTVFVFGGSLGAKALNEKMLGALSFLEDLKPQLHIIHQTGRGHAEAAQKEYHKRGFSNDVREFIDDMSACYAKSDLVLCRAGATTLAEVTVCKRAAILVPFPFAADDHQTLNAKELSDAGAAIVIQESELTPERLANEIRMLKDDESRRRKMERAAGLLGKPEAARELTEVCVELASGPGGSQREALS